MAERDPELALLEPIVGEWRSEGTLSAASGTPGATFTAIDTYEWLPGGHFLVHRWDARMPEGRVQGLEVIGRDHREGGFFLHSYDSSGNAGVMEARVQDDRWTFSGDTMRFRGRFSANGRVFSGTWELRSDPDEPWTPWMSVTLRKATS